MPQIRLSTPTAWATLPVRDPPPGFEMPDPKAAMLMGCYARTARVIGEGPNMSADLTTAPHPPCPPDHPEAPLYALAAKYPEPDWKLTAADRFWLAEQQTSGALDAHVGKVVAVLEKRVIGVGDDYIAMLLDLSPKYDVHPGRIVVVGLDE